MNPLNIYDFAYFSLFQKKTKEKNLLQKIINQEERPSIEEKFSRQLKLEK